MAFIAPVLAAVGGGSAIAGAVTVATAAAAVYQGVQAGKEADAAAQGAQQNADNARLVANAKEEQVRRRNVLMLGEQRAAAAQSGFDPSSGSLLRLQGDSAGQLELDALTTRYEGAMTSLSLENEAAAYKRKASSARTSGYMNAAGSLLGSVGRTYGQQRIGPLAPVEDRSLNLKY